jgi:Family of unknown function (DUF6491)
VSILTRLMASMAVLGLLGGCVTAPAGAPPNKDVQLYLKYSGPPIDTFTYIGHYYAFRSLGGPYVVIWTKFDDAYMIKVMDPCINLPFANKLDLSSTSRVVDRHFDWVIVGEDHCRIDTIQHVDYQAMKAAHVAGP